MERKPTNRRRVLAGTVLGAAAVMVCGLAQNMQRGQTRSPHGTLRVPCASCHTSISWKPLRAVPEFDHNRETRYPLRAMHARVDCKLCHASLVFKEASRACADCHADIHRRQMGTRCEDCHSVRGWQVGRQSIREHSARFPLTGAHAAADCEQCHRGAAAAQFTGASTACASCHIKEYSNTRTINHAAAGFAVECEQCHNIDTWFNVRFDHARFTGFALVGAHVTLDCASCHAGNQFKGTPAACYACHTRDYTSAANPNHVAAGFPTDCSLCHGSAAWSPASFNHARTAFPLTGAHSATACAQCHVNNQFASTPTLCGACHLTEFNQATDPNHVTAGFPTDCSVCHSTVNWLGAVFDHAKTKFPLTGAHVKLDCAVCHTNGQFASISTACSSCHMPQFNASTNPNHAASGFPATCETCHSTTAWSPATFNHSTTKFPLTGAHVNVACASCHVGNVFAGTPTDCYSCHKPEYQQTTNPNHIASGFPTTCVSCHNTTTWTGATFTHSRFPIYTGTHSQGRAWNTCADCHTNASNYQVFSCITCHTHDQPSTDPHHRGVRNYVYAATSCYSCHSTGGRR